MFSNKKCSEDNRLFLGGGREVQQKSESQPWTQNLSFIILCLFTHLFIYPSFPPSNHTSSYISGCLKRHPLPQSHHSHRHCWDNNVAERWAPHLSCSSLSIPFYLPSPVHAYLLSSFSTSLSPSPSTSSPACGRLIPLSAPRISPLLHGLVSSLSLSPFIYINEQKSSFHLPPDEQTQFVVEDRRKEEQNSEDHSFS